MFILAFIINALAPTFGAQKDSDKAFKVAVYAPTAAWVASFVGSGPSFLFFAALNLGNGAGYCPFGFGDFTFYSRYVANAGTDQREALASQFAVRYITGGLFDGGTDYIVWRDSRSTDIVGGACPAENDFAWYPLNQDLVVAFDENENSEELCFLESDVSPPTGGQQTCFPNETGRYNVRDSAVPGSQTLDPSFDFGWMFLDLDLTSVIESQAWVTAVMSAEGRFSVGFDAIQLDNASEGGLILNGER